MWTVKLDNINLKVNKPVGSFRVTQGAYIEESIFEMMTPKIGIFHEVSLTKFNRLTLFMVNSCTLWSNLFSFEFTSSSNACHEGLLSQESSILWASIYNMHRIMIVINELGILFKNYLITPIKNVFHDLSWLMFFEANFPKIFLRFVFSECSFFLTSR